MIIIPRPVVIPLDRVYREGMAIIKGGGWLSEVRAMESMLRGVEVVGHSYCFRVLMRKRIL
jgi:hypothetical protein